jgi:hypothetical protein
MLDSIDFLNPEKKGFPAPPRAHIGVKSWSTTADGIIQISAECRTPKEVDAYVEQMKRDLDKISREAKKSFEQAWKTSPYRRKKKEG